MRRLAVGVVIAGLTLNTVVALYGAIAHPALNSDFLAFWSFPRFAAARPVAGIYDANALRGFQQALYPGFHSFYPYLYPPTLLLPLWWLRFCGFAAAQTIWTLAGLAGLLGAGAAFFRPGQKLFGIAALLGSPAALLTGATGETAFFTTALLLAGFAALPRRKLLAGLAFGLLTLKPQLGVLIPFALLARGEWRVIAVAAATALALAGLSCAAFPASLWLVWARSLPAYQADYFAAAKALNLNIIITPAANLIVLGAGARLAWLVQWGVGLGVIALVVTVFRRAAPAAAVAVLFAGMFLAVPHAYAYDSLPLTAALVLSGRRGGLAPPFMALAAVIYLGPLLLLSPISHYFLYAGPEILLLGFVARLALAKVSIETTGDEPDHGIPNS